MTEITIAERYKVQFCVDRKGMMHAVATIPTPGGPLRLTACYPMHEAAKLLRRYLAKMGIKVQGAESGGFFDKLKKITAKIARAKALAPVLQAVQAVQKNPVLARAVGLTTAVIPGLGSATVAVKAAASLVQKASKGDLKSLASLRQLKSLALMGIPKARDAYDLARRTYGAIQARKPVDLLKGLAAPVVNQIKEATALPAQVFEAKNKILAALPPHLRGIANQALQQVPGVAALEGAAQVHRASSAVSGAIAPLLEVLDQGGPPYAAGAYYGC